MLSASLRKFTFFLIDVNLTKRTTAQHVVYPLSFEDDFIAYVVVFIVFVHGCLVVQVFFFQVDKVVVIVYVFVDKEASAVVDGVFGFHVDSDQSKDEVHEAFVCEFTFLFVTPYIGFEVLIVVNTVAPLFFTQSLCLQYY